METKFGEIEQKNYSIKIEERIEELEKKLETHFKAVDIVMKLFSKQIDKFCDHINDIVVELNDDIGK